MSSTVPYRIGVCSWSLRPANAAELVERVRACGLGLVQLALDPLGESPEGWGDVKERLADAGIAIASGMFGCVGEDYSTLDSIRKTGGFVADVHWEANQQRAKAAIAAAGRLGIRTITTHVGFIEHNAPSFPKMVDRVRWVAKAMADAGMTMLFETGQETADDLVAFLDAVSLDNVGVNFDPANMILYDKGEPVAALRRLMPHVRQVHIKDAARTKTPGTWGNETPVGEGEVDWPAFLDALASGGYRGDLLIEREGGDRRAEEVRLARERLEAWLTRQPA